MNATPVLDNPVESLDLDALSSALDDRGYTVLPSVISPREADEVRTILTHLLDTEISASHREAKTQRVGRIAVKHPVFLDLMSHPTVVAIWKRWLGEDVICSTWTANTVYPGFDRIGWHADYPYWSITPPWPTGRLTGQTLWMLDDFTEENGATGVVPYSHLKLSPPDNGAVWHEDAEIITGVRGSVVVLHGALWHTARPNRTPHPRSALLGMYIRPCCLPMEDMRGQLADLPDAPNDLIQQLMGAKQRQPSDVTG